MVTVESKGKVSLICTFYNRERYLAECIESALDQSYPHWELILWDDGSSDDSLNIAEKYALSDRRIQLFTAEHQGRAMALAKAHQQATGKYLAWLDSDDYLERTTLERCIWYLDRYPNIGMFYTDCYEFDDKGCIRVNCRAKAGYSYQNLLKAFITFHFRIFRSELFTRVGGIDTSLEAAIDYDLSLKLASNTNVLRIPEALYYYRLHEQRMSVTHKDKQNESASKLQIAFSRHVGKSD